MPTRERCSWALVADFDPYYECTLPADHAGMHEHTNAHGRLMATWWSWDRGARIPAAS